LYLFLYGFVKIDTQFILGEPTINDTGDRIRTLVSLGIFVIGILAFLNIPGDIKWRVALFFWCCGLAGIGEGYHSVLTGKGKKNRCK